MFSSKCFLNLCSPSLCSIGKIIYCEYFNITFLFIKIKLLNITNLFQVNASMTIRYSSSPPSLHSKLRLKEKVSDVTQISRRRIQSPRIVILYV